MGAAIVDQLMEMTLAIQPPEVVAAGALWRLRVVMVVLAHAVMLAGLANMGQVHAARLG